MLLHRACRLKVCCGFGLVWAACASMQQFQLKRLGFQPQMPLSNRRIRPIVCRWHGLDWIVCACICAPCHDSDPLRQRCTDHIQLKLEAAFVSGQVLQKFVAPLLDNKKNGKTRFPLVWCQHHFTVQPFLVQPMLAHAVKVYAANQILACGQAIRSGFFRQIGWRCRGGNKARLHLRTGGRLSWL